jgi:SAM-dependent methyltransferase
MLSQLRRAIYRFVKHPLARDVNVDDPLMMDIRRQIIDEKPFLKKIHEDWYAAIASELRQGEDTILELGSGIGFMKNVIPNLISSDIVPCADLDILLDGCELPFKDNSLNSIVMTNVFHHLPNPRRFFTESARCISIGGIIVMIEPWVTPWSRFINKLHYEPFRPNDLQWEFLNTGPISGSNNALAWIVFERDRSQFEREFPCWKIHKIKLMMPFRYILSGGIYFRNLFPPFTYKIIRAIEENLDIFIDKIAMFAQITLIKKP